MKANELRINNYLLDREDRLCRVEEISSKYDEDLFDEPFEAPALNSPLTSIPHKPIPLTEEWLVKFGFDKEPKKYNSIKYYKHYKFDYRKLPLVDFIIYDFEYCATGEFFKGWLIPLTDGDFYMNCKNIEIKYVHELQNLYFTITGEELTIKE